MIGAGIGALAGGLIGNAIGESQRDYLAQGHPETLHRVDSGHPLTPYDVIALTRAGVSDRVIISQINNTGTVYHLSTEQIIDLRNNGVSDSVIEYMISTGGRGGSYYVVEERYEPEYCPPTHGGYYGY